jgi:acyl-CoA thioester hydrolase
VTAVDRPVRSDYVVWRTATTRWADDDVYGHMNNATYFELIDTAVNAHLWEATGTDIRRLPAVGVVAEVSCRYFTEIRFPDPVDLGLAVERVGRSSVTYRIGLFQGQRSGSQPANAEGRFVHVYVDNTVTDGQRPVVPVPAELRPVMEALVPSRE